MGSENLFHKRRAKAADRLGRKKAKRSSYDKVLIVCEGEKTEPNYFRELIDIYEINTANVAIDGTGGSSPKSVLNRAIELYELEDRKGDPFDSVYCVFDKDRHDSYEETLSKIASKRPKGIFYAAVSIPCFEYWLLLHFAYSTKPYATTGSKSIGEEVLKDLLNFMPGYTKGTRNVFSTLYPQLDFAKANAARVLQNAHDNHTDNPSTYAHELIEYLQNIKCVKKE